MTSEFDVEIEILHDLAENSFECNEGNWIRKIWFQDGLYNDIYRKLENKYKLGKVKTKKFQGKTPSFAFTPGQINRAAKDLEKKGIIKIGPSQTLITRKRGRRKSGKGPNLHKKKPVTFTQWGIICWASYALARKHLTLNTFLKRLKKIVEGNKESLGIIG